ncbi:LysR family transcriptional regulator [Vibrio makurazakiensis]|uniref:LysR family transcriptional regulator n=1 Tax=Vibrio makurazakiensis TaxID=2910250 RepID=UPI003D0E0C4D
MSSIFGNVDDLFLFCTVVEEGSLLSAAKKLQLPVSTMSRRLTALEARLNIRLLEKQGRELVPTMVGQEAFKALNSGMESIQTAFTGLLTGRESVQGRIKLAIPHNFYSGFVGKIIEEFLSQYPNVQLDLVLSQEQAVPQTDRDLLMTFDISSLEGMIARPLFTARHGFFASPEYLQSHPAIETADDLEKHLWVSVDNLRQIPVFQGEELLQMISITPKLIVNDIHAVVQATEKGIGIASLPFRHVSHSMNLIQILPEYHRSDRQAYLVYKERKYQPKALTLLIEALIEGIQLAQKLVPVK